MKKIMENLSFMMKTALLGSLWFGVYSFYMVLQEFPLKDHLVLYFINWLVITFFSGFWFSYQSEGSAFRYLGVTFYKWALIYSVLGTVISTIFFFFITHWMGRDLRTLFLLLPIGAVLFGCIYTYYHFRKDIRKSIHMNTIS